MSTTQIPDTCQQKRGLYVERFIPKEILQLKVTYLRTQIFYAGFFAGFLLLVGLFLTQPVMEILTELFSRGGDKRILVAYLIIAGIGIYFLLLIVWPVYKLAKELHGSFCTVTTYALNYKKLFKKMTLPLSQIDGLRCEHSIFTSTESSPMATVQLQYQSPEKPGQWLTFIQWNDDNTDLTEQQSQFLDKALKTFQSASQEK